MFEVIDEGVDDREIDWHIVGVHYDGFVVDGAW